MTRRATGLYLECAGGGGGGVSTLKLPSIGATLENAVTNLKKKHFRMSCIFNRICTTLKNKIFNNFDKIYNIKLFIYKSVLTCSLYLSKLICFAKKKKRCDVINFVFTATR